MEEQPDSTVTCKKLEGEIVFDDVDFGCAGNPWPVNRVKGPVLPAIHRQGVGCLGNAAANIILLLTSILLAPGMMIGDGTSS